MQEVFSIVWRVGGRPEGMRLGELRAPLVPAAARCITCCVDATARACQGYAPPVP